jgi:hypothetical protein
MARIASTLLTGILALAPASRVDVGVHAGTPAEPVIQIVSSDTLRDVAVAVFDAIHPVIYVNEVRLRQFEPGVQQFFLAHEHGHITLHHTRSYALNGTAEGQRAAIVSRELEADCWASQTLGRENRPAVLTAARFFAAMGPYRYDREHPSGSQRAARIMACLPDVSVTPQH